MIKSMIGCLFLLGATSGLAGENLGQKRNFYVEQGKPNFGVQVVHDSDTAWMITASLDGPAISAGQPVTLVAWRLWDEKANGYLNDWTIIQQGDSTTLLGGLPFTGGLSGKAAIPAMTDMQSLKLVISVNQPVNLLTPSYFIDFSSLCESASNQFSDLTTGKTGCTIGN